MKPVKVSALLMTASAALALVACTTDSDNSDSAKAKDVATSSSPAAQSQETVTAPALPSAADLNAVLAKAVDPNIPREEKVTTVQNGEQAPELFDLITASQMESGATLNIVEPVLPGYTPDSVLATAKLQTPDQPEQTAENVEFVFENGTWKLSQSWACTLVTNTVAPEQVPPLCQTQAVPQNPAQAGEAMPPAPEGELPPPPQGEVPPAPEGQLPPPPQGEVPPAPQS